MAEIVRADMAKACSVGYTSTDAYTYALSFDMISQLGSSLDPAFIKSQVEFYKKLD